VAYSKLYSSIVHSSLWNELDHVRLLFITLLAICDREGYVYGSRDGLVRLANLDSDQCEDVDPFEVLLNPDKDSSDLLRNPENEGRRIEQVPGGFRIINFSYYRGLRNEDDRREQNKQAQRRHKQKISQDKPCSAKISQDKPTPSASASSSSVSASASKSKCTQKEAEEYCISIGLPGSDGKAMFLHWEEKGWAKIKDWKLTIQKWKSFGYLPSQKQKKPFGKPTEQSELDKRLARDPDSPWYEERT
jgi:hypothetical protein